MANNKSKTANLGEISEFYSFAYIVGHQEVEIVDDQLNPNGDKLTFLKLYRNFDDKNQAREVYDLTSVANGGNLVPVEIKGHKAGDIPLCQLKPMITNLKTLLLNKAAGSAKTKIPINDKAVADLMSALKTTKIRAKSENKQDYEGQVVFTKAPLSSRVGFSVKSEVGKDATLINVSGMNSAFAYSLCHSDGTILSKQEVANLEQLACKNGIKSAGKKLICFLRDQGVDFDFIRCMCSALEYNLRLDSDNGDLLIAALMLEANTTRGKTNLVPDAVNLVLQPGNGATLVSKRLLKTLGFSKQDQRQVLEHRFKGFLLNFLRGAEVSTKWNGRDSVNGGFIIVTSNADVFCLDMLTRNSVADYLYNKIYFDTPSISRHLKEDKLIFELNGEPCVYLFMQVRSKK